MLTRRHLACVLVVGLSLFGAAVAQNTAPVIFMTALTDSEHVVQGFRVGGIDYVTKPVKPSEVSARIAAHVQRCLSALKLPEDVIVTADVDAIQLM